MGGRGSKQRRVFRARRFIHLPFRVLSFQGTTHVGATQPSASRTAEVQFLVGDTLAAGHMWRIASMTRSARSPKAHFQNSPYARAPRGGGIRAHRPNRFIRRHSISLTRAACFESRRELSSDNLKVYSERRSF